MAEEEQGAPQGADESAPAAAPAEPVAEPDTNAPEPGTEQPAKTEPDADPEKPKDQQPWYLKRINQQSAKIADLARQAESLAREKAELESRFSRNDDEQSGEKPITPQDVDRLVELRAQEHARVQSFNQACDSTFDAGTKEFPDFPRAVETLKALGAMQPDKVQIVLDAAGPDAHKALYQLGKNPEEAERVFSLPPIRMAVELAKLAATPPKPVLPPLSNAPDPITPVAGSGRVETNPDKMSTEQWFAWREKQVRSPR